MVSFARTHSRKSSVVVAENLSALIVLTTSCPSQKLLVAENLSALMDKDLQRLPRLLGSPIRDAFVTLSAS
jgi:hypothetical protein